MKYFSLIFLLFLSSTPQSHATEAKKISFNSNGKNIDAYLCKPDINTTKSAVIYLHGSHRSGAIVETCKAIAAQGYFGLAPLRPNNMKKLEEMMRLTKDSVLYAESSLGISKDNISLIGYSQGGALAYRYSVAVGGIKSGVILGSGASPKGGRWGTKKINVPLLIMVAENDTGSSTTYGRNFLKETKQLVKGLEENNKIHRYIVLPPYGADGHKIFWEVGDYWNEISAFLKQHHQ